MDFRKILHGFRRCRAEVIFAGCWIVGLLLGIVAAQNTDPGFLSAFSRLPASPLSGAGRIVSMALPFAVTFCCRKIHAISLIAGLRVFAFAYVGMALHMVFGLAGWLIHLLLQFGAIFSLPLYCWFCIRRMTGREASVKSDMLIICSFTVAIAAVDLYLIAPLLYRISF